MRRRKCFWNSSPRKEKKLSRGQINMDEVPVTFDCPLSRTVNSIGEESVSISTNGNGRHLSLAF